LQHVLGLAPVLQYTDEDAEKLRRGVLIDEAQRRAVTGADSCQRGSQFPACDLGIHAGLSQRQLSAHQSRARYRRPLYDLQRPPDAGFGTPHFQEMPTRDGPQKESPWLLAKGSSLHDKHFDLSNCLYAWIQRFNSAIVPALPAASPPMRLLARRGSRGHGEPIP
jgi:hypothetical protein